MKGESDADTEPGSFGAASFWKKTKILFAGVVMNWLVAAIILTILAFVGMPHFIEGQFTIPSDTRVLVKTPVTLTSVMDDSPAKFAGMEVGDVIQQVRVLNGDLNERYQILTTDDLLSFDSNHKGQIVYFTFERNGESKMAEVKLNGDDSDYVLGAGITGEAYYQSSWSSPIVGIGTTLQITGETFRGVGKLLVNLVSGAVQQLNPNENVREEGAKAIGEAGDSVAGPVGIVGVLFPAFVSSGGLNLFFLVALISISLACMNVLPIPALDGGRWLLIAIYRLRKKKLTKEKEEKIVGRAFMVILALAAIVTIIDILRLVK